MGIFRFKVVLACALAAGCDSSRPPVAPEPIVPGPAAALSFANVAQDVRAGERLPAFRIHVVDSSGAPVSGAEILLDFDSAPAGAKLRGRRSALSVDGIATFDSVIIPGPGEAYSLRASAGELRAVSGNIRSRARLVIVNSANQLPLGWLVISVAIMNYAGEVVSLPGQQIQLVHGNGPHRQLEPDTVRVATAHAGYAIFRGFHVSRPGSGYAIIASASSPLLDDDTLRYTAGFQTQQMSLGMAHTCVLGSNGAAICWGDNQTGQLGRPAVTDESTPVRVRAGVAFATISAGLLHTCALSEGGTAYCWGHAPGNGRSANHDVAVAFAAPVRFRAIHAGGGFTCALAVDDAAWCWGSNDRGQLGNGTTVTTVAPSPVQGGLRFVSLTAGASHNCGLTAGGEVWCWGANFHGQLGVGDTVTRLAPVQIPGHSFTAIDAGWDATCALAQGGAAWCWGAGRVLARGADMLTPSPVPGGYQFVEIAMGGATACGRSSGNLLFCWGGNDAGQFGNGTQGTISAMPLAAAISGVIRFSVGSYHTCGVASSGLFCWGLDESGQLGNGQPLADAPAPVRVIQE